MVVKSAYGKKGVGNAGAKQRPTQPQYYWQLHEDFPQRNDTGLVGPRPLGGKSIGATVRSENGADCRNYHALKARPAGPLM